MGALAEAFDYNVYGGRSVARRDDWKNEFNQIRELVKEVSDLLGLNESDLYYELRNSARTAFYTSPEVISAMYSMAAQLGYKGGNILEPSMGTGNFFGVLPSSMSNSRLYGTELDPLTGNIAKLLYPNASIQIKGYQDTKYPDGFFDLAIGNVPFANISIKDKAIKDPKLGEKIHDYFFVKTISLSTWWIGSAFMSYSRMS